MWRGLIGKNFKEFSFKTAALEGKVNKGAHLHKYYERNVWKDMQHLNPQLWMPMDALKPREDFKEHIEIRYLKSATTHRIFTEGLSDFQINNEIKKHLISAEELLKKYPMQEEERPPAFYYFDRRFPVAPDMFPLDDRVANPE